MIDLRNTREEALSVAELKGSQDNHLAVNKTTKEDTEHHTKPHTRNEESRRTSFNSERSMDQDDDDDKETKYRLDPKYVVPLVHLIRCPMNLYIPMLFLFLSRTVFVNQDKIAEYFLVLYLMILCFTFFRYANVRTPERHVRTRLYFTSVSGNMQLNFLVFYCYFLAAVRT